MPGSNTTDVETSNQAILNLEASPAGRRNPDHGVRCHDVDWLRVLGIGTVFLFHCGKFFDKDDWHVKNAAVSQFATVAINIVAQWMMPLFFVLSGISTYLSLRHLTPRQFVVAKSKRLAIPLILGTFVVLIPVQVYFERVSHGKFSGSFAQFYPHYFEGWYGFGGNFAWMGLHLWYLEMLFIFSILLLPLFVWLRKQSHRDWLAGTSRFCSKPGAFLIPVTVVLTMEGITRWEPVKNSVLGWRAFGSWPLPQHFVFFVLGYGIAIIPRLRATIEDYRSAGLAIGISVTTFAYWLTLAKGQSGDGVFFAILRSVNVIAWLVAILGYGSKFLNFENGFLKYANEAVLPFYILHQTVILGIGFFVVRWNIGIGVKFLIIALSSLVLIVATYDLVIKRVNTLRFMFGMKLRANVRST